MGALAPDKILKELADLWVSMGKQGEGEGDHGVLRACTMTLIVMSEETEDAGALGEIIAALMPEHPARTILVRMRAAGAPAELAERVYAQCWMPFGQRRQICCEQVEIAASEPDLAELPSVLLPLAAPDLPVVLWSRCPRLLDEPAFGGIAAAADKVILDTAGAPDARSALARLSAAVDAGWALGDLAWTRLTRWRQTIADIFENREYLAGLAGPLRVTLEPGGPVVATQELYLAAWLKDAVSSADVHVRPAQAGGLLPALELHGPALDLRLERQDGCLRVTVNGLTHCTSLSLPNDYLLMREELGILRRDPVFERTLASAARLAYATD